MEYRLVTSASSYLRPVAALVLAAVLSASTPVYGGMSLCFWRGLAVLDRPRSAEDLRTALEYALGQYEARAIDPRGPTVGVEVEGLFPGWRSRKDAALVVKVAVEKAYPGAVVKVSRILWAKNVRADGFRVQFQWQGQTYTWKLIDDASIRGPTDPLRLLWNKRPFRGDTALEVVSPVLRDAQDRDAYFQVMAALRDQGYVDLPGRAGTHVHVGAEDASVAELVTLAQVFGLSEEQIMSTFGVSNERMRQFSVPIRGTAENALMAFQDPEKIAWVEAQLKSTRSQSLNFQPLDRLGTVEYKFFDSTLDPGHLRSAVDFAIALTEAVRTKNPELFTYLTSTPPESIELPKLAQILRVSLDIPADVQARWTERSRALYHSVQPKSAIAEFWRNDKNRLAIAAVGAVAAVGLLGLEFAYLPTPAASASPSPPK